MNDTFRLRLVFQPHLTVGDRLALHQRMLQAARGASPHVIVRQTDVEDSGNYVTHFEFPRALPDADKHATVRAIHEWARLPENRNGIVGTKAMDRTWYQHVHGTVDPSLPRGTP